MNLAKSMYISTYMMLAMIVAGYAIWMLRLGGNPIGWSGVLLTVAPIMMVIGWLMMFKSSARTSAHFPLLGVLAALGSLMAALAVVSSAAGPLVLALALSGLVGFIIYAYWYSSFGRQSSVVLKVGQTLPNFSVLDTDRKAISAKELTGRAAIFLFFRGNWCPLCMAQIKELVKQYKEIGDNGVSVSLISPQPHRNTIGLAKKFGVDFNFLTDDRNKAARALGIAAPNGLPFGMQMVGYRSETVLPTVIITDQNSKIIWVHETDNYRVRPDPDVYIGVLRQHGLIPAGFGEKWS